jgi:hypothetical protein
LAEELGLAPGISNTAPQSGHLHLRPAIFAARRKFFMHPGQSKVMDMGEHLSSTGMKKLLPLLRREEYGREPRPLPLRVVNR